MHIIAVKLISYIPFQVFYYTSHTSKEQRQNELKKERKINEHLMFRLHRTLLRKNAG